MQVTNTSTNTVIVGKAKVESFKLAQTKEFFEILTKNLYSNPLKAVIRETICNAWDAHIAAGKTDTPIDISYENACFTVRDYGNGIPHEEMENIYAVFGTSTKVMDTAQTGGFGLGCKAPFAITDVFTVENIHNGKKGIYTCVRSDSDNEGLPSIRTIVMVDTEEPSGLKVSVPFVNKDKRKVDKYISEIVTAGEIPNTYVDPKPIEKDKDFFLINIDSYSGTGYFCRYGSVAYHIDTNKLTAYDSYISLPSDFSPVLEIPPNSLTVSPSREELVYDEKTVNTLNKAFNKHFEHIKKHWKEYAIKTLVNNLGYFGNIKNSYYIKSLVLQEKVTQLAAYYLYIAINKGYSFKNLIPLLYPYAPQCLTKLFRHKQYYRVDKAKYELNKIFKEDYTKLYWINDSIANRVAVVKQLYSKVCTLTCDYDSRVGFTKQATSLYNFPFISAKLILTNNVSNYYRDNNAWLEGDTFLISVKNSSNNSIEEKRKKYEAMGFNVEVFLTEPVKKKSSSKVKERRFIGKGSLKLKSSNIHCYANNYSYAYALEHILNDTPCLEELLKSIDYDTALKDINCLYALSQDSVLIRRNKIPSLTWYLSTTWYKENITDGLCRKFSLLVSNSFAKHNVSPTVFNNLEDNGIIYALFLEYKGITESISAVSSDILKELESFSDTEKLLFVYWFKYERKKQPNAYEQEYREFMYKLERVCKHSPLEYTDTLIARINLLSSIRKTQIKLLKVLFGEL